MSELADALDDVVARLGTLGLPVVVGPPWITPPAPPCYIVTLPELRSYQPTAPGCGVAETTVEVGCLPPTATGREEMLGMADQVIDLFGGRVSSGRAEVTDLTDVDAHIYRITLEF